MAGCSVPDVPPGGDQPSEASVAGMLKLFQRECVHQRSIEWAREKARDRTFGCGTLFDCEYATEAANMSWQVPVGARSVAKITLWYPLGHPERLRTHPPERVTCQLEVSDDIGPYLREVAQKAAVAAGLNPEVQYTKSGDDETWIWPPADGDAAKPEIELYFSPSITGGLPGEPIRRWELRYAVFMHGPFIW